MPSPPIDQSQPFNKRLKDFGEELGKFLGEVWKARGTINLRSFDRGTYQIYQLYSGTTPDLPYSTDDLKRFIADLLKVSGKYAVDSQVFEKSLDDFTTEEILVNGNDLWTDFFHVLATAKPARAIRNRVYVHAADAASSLKIMKGIIDQFGENPGLWEVKTAGPGATRLDTIVAYLYDEESANALVGELKEMGKKKAAWFTDSLPPLIKKEGKGIGTAGEPPAIEIYAKKGKRHSFGSFYSCLCWIALKNTPNVAEKEADGRHMLDNLLFSLRALEVDPAKPQQFPKAKKLEAWYRAAMTDK